MSDLKINNITNRGGDGGPVISGISTVATSTFMVMPSGDTAIRGAGSGRMLLMGGFGNAPAATYQNQIQLLTISTTGDAKDYGDLQHAKSEASGCSNGHGGL